MFLQVGVKKEGQPFLSFWWREPGDPRPPKTHQMTVMPFGAIASPSACLFVVWRTLEGNPKFGDLKDKIQWNMFVDNYLDSFDTQKRSNANVQEDNGATQKRSIPPKQMAIVVKSSADVNTTY